MNLLSYLPFALVFLLSQQVNASGQRTTLLNHKNIEKYKVLTLRENQLTERYLHYIGTINNKYHVLMITKTSHSKSSSGRIGMPFDRVFKYKISVDEMTIINGWDLTDKITQGSFKVRPSYCPELAILPKQSKYVLPNSEKIKLDCLKMRRSH